MLDHTIEKFIVFPQSFYYCIVFIHTKSKLWFHFLWFDLSNDRKCFEEEKVIPAYGGNVFNGTHPSRRQTHTHTHTHTQNIIIIIIIIIHTDMCMYEYDQFKQTPRCGIGIKRRSVPNKTSVVNRSKTWQLHARLSNKVSNHMHINLSNKAIETTWVAMERNGKCHDISMGHTRAIVVSWSVWMSDLARMWHWSESVLKWR